jgi:hypothetical protein
MSKKENDDRYGTRYTEMTYIFGIPIKDGFGSVSKQHEPILFLASTTLSRSFTTTSMSSLIDLSDRLESLNIFIFLTVN